jgi:alpha-galactosidase
VEGARPDVAVATDGDVEVVRLTLELPEPQVPQPFTVSFRLPLVDVHGLWRPAFVPGPWQGQSLEPPWESWETSATRGAPVASLYAADGTNRVTFACSDARNPLTLRANVDEDTAELVCSVTFFAVPTAPLQRYEAELRIDRRPVPYHEALDGVRAWWEGFFPPAPIPPAAREPVYSTWYAFHLGITADGVERQCALARELGCGVVIIDDGWQTETFARGYSSTGDWQPAPAKFPDFAGHVARLQQLGLKVMLWFAMPFVGEQSAAWHDLQGKLLAYKPYGWDAVWGVVDPRFPDVRARMAATYDRALREWELDGLKLDFLDEFKLREGDAFGGERDTDSVVDALELVLGEIDTPLIEFRQTYTGPLMRSFATMLRAYDCPNDALENRIRTLTLRLLAGSTPVHSDMLMWHPEDSVESAALQLLSVLFSVPQVSVLIDELPPDHLEMLRFWLGFWLEHRETLLDGTLRPLRPQGSYALVFAELNDDLVIAAYESELVPLVPRARTSVVNAAGGSRLALELSGPWAGTLRVRDARGRVLRDEAAELAAGIVSLAVPRSGLVELLA